MHTNFATTHAMWRVPIYHYYSSHHPYLCQGMSPLRSKLGWNLKIENFNPNSYHQLSSRVLGWKVATRANKPIGFARWVTEDGCEIQSLDGPSTFTLSISRHLFFLSILYRSGNIVLRVSDPTHRSCQKRVALPFPLFLTITLLISIPILFKSSAIPSILFQTPLIRFVDIRLLHL